MAHPILALVRDQLSRVTCEVMFQWVPGHCGLPGNEKADQEAKEAAAQGIGPGGIQNAPVSFQAAKSSIRRVVRDPSPGGRTSQVYRGPRRHPQGLSRKEEVVLAQLRSGHSLHLATYKNRVSGDDSTCPRCGEGDETLEHLFQSCIALEACRVTCFGSPSPPLSVLWGEPDRVVRYLRSCGIL